MSEPELEKLLGGFAADQLTPEERQKLFTAALQDQELFNALADEQVLKEVLADPAVRRRLLEALRQPHRAGDWRSWLDRFTRPVGLAWVGGVAAGVFAVVLGLNVYQESVRRASETAALEEKMQAPPPAVPPSVPPGQEPFIERERKEPTVAPEPPAKERFSQTLDSREQAAASRPRKGPASSNMQDKQQTLPQKEESQKGNAPLAAFGKSSKQADSSDQLSTLRPSSTERDTDILLQADSGTSTSVSARSLFYGQGSVVQEPALSSEEKRVEPARKIEPFAFTRKALDQTAPMTPLAIRYSFVIRESGEEREVDAVSAVNTVEPVTLSVESNQEAYIQVWTRTGDSLPELVLPAKESGRISLKTAPGQRQHMTMPGVTERLILRLSRVPFGPITRQEAVMAGRGGSGQLTESVSGPNEQAIYVANPDLSAVELAVEIPFRTNRPR